MANEHPYRTPKSDEPASAPKALVYNPGGDERVGPARAALQAFVGGSVIGTALILAGQPGIAIGVFLVGLVVAYRRWKAPPPAVGTTFSVERGVLKVQVAGEGEPRVAMLLDDVLDVVLDTKTIQRGADVGALSGLGGGATAPADVARVAIVTNRAPDEPVAATDDYFPHIECVEWLGKIRRFLRAHGWLPLDERKKTSPSVVA